MVTDHPEILKMSSNKYQNWETTDPECWVPHGYAIVRIDSRGAGWSPGFMDPASPREIDDLYQCIEWAGTQPWSNGKVGINGISYYAMNQWQVGALQPKHLAALCIWEGASDYYRDLSRHGGILCDFLNSWYNRQVLSVQNGVGDRGARNPVTGDTIAGPDTLTDEQLKSNRADVDGEALRRPFIDDYYRARMPDFSKIKTPLLSAGNWGGQGLHPRGNFEGYLRAASGQKWLEVHGDTHFTHFYSGYGVALQKKFFGHFLKGENTGWNQQPRVSLNVRWPGEKFVLRAENEWPLARTQWTKYYLQPDDFNLGTELKTSTKTIRYVTSGDGVTFTTPPLTHDLEITGPVAAKLWLSSDTTDADVFVALRVYDPAGKEVTFIGSNDPRTPVGLGWLRASHRKLDAKRSLPYRPCHAHNERWWLKKGEVVECQVEVISTSIVIKKGNRLRLDITPKDGVGSGHFTHYHADYNDGALNTLHVAKDKPAYIMLPIIPPKEEEKKP